MNFNKTFIGGRLVRDPELKYTTTNKAVCNFSVACNSGRGDEQDTLFVECVAWEKTGETISQYLSKGDPIFVEGALREDRWEDKDGNKRTKMKLTVFSFQFVGSKSKSERSVEVPTRTVRDEDIPF